MKHKIEVSSIKIIDTDNSGTVTDAGYRAQHFIYELERKNDEKGLDPHATKYAIFIAAQESRIKHIIDASETGQIPHQFASSEINEANLEIGKVWQNVLIENKTRPGLDIYLNSALTVLRTYGSVVASQDTFKILFQWAENKITHEPNITNALLSQDKLSTQLKEANDLHSEFYRRTVQQIFGLNTPDEIRLSLNNLVESANTEQTELRYYIYNALNEYYHEHVRNNDQVDPYVGYHLYSILGPEPFITGGGVPVINGQLANCTNFDFILDQRREKIKQLRHKQ